MFLTIKARSELAYIAEDEPANLADYNISYQVGNTTSRSSEKEQTEISDARERKEEDTEA